MAENNEQSYARALGGCLMFVMISLILIGVMINLGFTIFG